MVFFKSSVVLLALASCNAPSVHGDLGDSRPTTSLAKDTKEEAGDGRSLQTSFTTASGDQETCFGTFTDTGGPNSKYKNGDFHTITICPDEDNVDVQVSFAYFAMEDTGGRCIWDYMNIYAGTDKTTLISGRHCANNSPGTIKSAHSTGCLTFEWQTDGAVNDSGFSADVRCVARPRTDPAALEQKWNISEDASFEYSSLSFKLGYTVSDFISNPLLARKLEDNTYPNSGMARFSVYDDGCKEDGVEILANTTSGIASIVPDLDQLTSAAGTGHFMDREAVVNITIDPEAIAQNDILYTEDTSGFQVTAEIRFCVRFGLHTTSATSVEVNFLETLVTLNVDLTDGFEIGSISVEPRDRLVRTANQVYLVVGYRCDANNNAVGNTDPINQGTVVKVCVEPDSEAIADGIKMRSIDDFTWTRSTPNVVNQPAIIGRNVVANNQLTTLDCLPGDAICTFDTILFAAFYTTPGAVLGSGVASMQFGTTDNGVGRRLRGETGDGRDLQADDAAAAAEFELDFDVAQGLLPQGTSGTGSISVVAVMIFGAIVAALM
jgi:hypothetical protein